MIDYHVSDHWAEDEPAWVKSLVSSLDRRHGASSILPLTVVVNEVAEWVRLASGVDAWKPRPNRDSLRLDLDHSVAAIGPSLRDVILAPLAAFEAAFSHLVASANSTLSTPAGKRTNAVWTDVSASASALLSALCTDAAVGASWDDLVAIAQHRSLCGREYRPAAELLFAQLEHRGIDAEDLFGDLVSIVAFGRDRHALFEGDSTTPLQDRLRDARELVIAPAREQRVVVWLGYKGRVHQHLEAGNVSFYDALWAVPNAEPGRFEFAHKEELWEIVQHGLAFRVAERVDEDSEVDTIVRVDLGYTVAAGAVDRAKSIVETIMSIAIHRGGGIRPQFAQYQVLLSGVLAAGGFHAVHDQTGFPDDSYGVGITTDAITQHGPRIAEALSREELPQFLAAAIESQVAADRPFSRDMALRTPSEADISSIIPLSDRVVQHIAAHAGMGSSELFDLLGVRWAHSRWLLDLRRAAHMCLLSFAKNRSLHHELTVEWFSERPKRPWILFLADRADDLLSLCRLEHERAWIERMFSSISDHSTYSELVSDYAQEGLTLEARRRRVRNALVHGNPTSFSAIESVREYAEFVSGNALYIALESFVDATDPASMLAARTEEYTAMQGGQDAVSYWREQISKK